ncbi:MAG: hypothetical protein J6V17_03310 [Bacteroidales bacterium]|nr:hypothetical protein [Bacteroidales bacterium]
MTDPFRYSPHPLVRDAARKVIEKIDYQIAEGLLPAAVAKGLTDGKMLGVLICGPDKRILYAFSGSVGGTSNIDGFVPPIFDLTEDGGYYRIHEAEISEINREIENIGINEAEPLERSLKEATESMDLELIEMKYRKTQARSIPECQFANGEIKRTRDKWKKIISGLEEHLKEVRDRMNSLKRKRARMSDELQKWIFSQYVVMNASGEAASILEIFQGQGLTPPGGTGDCAAPKLLNYAYRHGLKPIAMGEFWYGKSPTTAVRTHGHFYPSCTSKCGPLLGYMMNGITASGERNVKTESLPTSLGPSHSQGHGRPWFFHPVPPKHSTSSIQSMNVEMIYEDEEIIVVDKPSGMPSVPGLDGRISLQEWIVESHRDQISGDAPDIRAVHRLDMDTSGLIIFAKTENAEINLKKQFEEHTVRKTYMARLSPSDTHISDIPVLKAGDKGKIELPLSADYDERPRQKVDVNQGKPSLTEYEVISVNEDRTTDILFYPHTGRTHQLRVHSAHILGLGRPILGDKLYGGCGNSWSDAGADCCLHLRANSIAFRHPSTGATLTFTTE